MATVTVKICDMCTEEQTHATDTVHFDHEGVDYESDLCAAHKQDWDSLEAARSQFAERARPSGPQSVPPTPSTARSRVHDTAERREENRAIRAWATQQGIDIGDRGRIPEELRTRFRTWKWNENHPVPEPETQPPVVWSTRGLGAPKQLDPESAMATHSETRQY